MREETRIGLQCLGPLTELLQRVRSAHPTTGIYEAADLCWSWRTARPTDDVPQLFWFDDQGRPEAAMIAIDWSGSIALDPVVIPDATPEWVAHVVERGLAHAADMGFDAVEIRVDRADTVLQDLLSGHGFIGETSPKDDVEAWMAAPARPPISPLHDEYLLSTRLDTMGRPHHNERGGPDLEERLRQTPLYRPDLDLVVHHRGGDVGGYGLFWFDPSTSTGLVEPMRTLDDHQRRGLGRHILTAGLDRLAAAGAERIKICFDPDNAAAAGLYLDVGFEPVKQTMIFSGSTKAHTAAASSGA